MKISALNRYYLQKILRQKTGLIINTRNTSLVLSLTQFSSDLDNFIPQEKIGELELLISLHEKLSSNRSIYGEKLLEIERDIFNILGIKFDGFAYVSLLNRLSGIAKKYLGNKIVANYWKESQPQEFDLDKFEVNHSGEIIFKGSKNTNLTREQQQKMQLWIENFISRCNVIIRNFEETILQSN